ncbi:MAG: MFS transporter [Halioglobus sp.]|nr:MFS transporter [Halioglobus sp.]
MNMVLRASTFAAFRVRSFRFQWPADLATSWALEMETIILGWYVLVETQSVFMLTVFASLLYVGTLLSPMFGVAGDRIGQRALLCIMRSVYAVCALVLMTATFFGVLTPAIVLATTFVVGLVRPSEFGMRMAMVAAIMPRNQLLGAMGVQRTTQDSARIAGALTGAGLVALLGMGPAYIVVSLFYLVSILLMLKAGDGRLAPRIPSPDRLTGQTANPPPRALPVSHPSPWSALKQGFAYAWDTPHLRAAMLLALLLNCTAFPLTNHLMPVVAKNVYHSDQTTLGYMVAAVATGALLGSLLVSHFAHRVSQGRMMIVFSVAWYLMLAVFAYMPSPALGIPVLVLTGLVQSIGLVPGNALLLRNSDERFRGRIMGIRTMAIYGNLPGLLLSGPLIASFGYTSTATFYCTVGILFTLVIAALWRDVLWRTDAPTNIK